MKTFAAQVTTSELSNCRVAFAPPAVKGPLRSRRQLQRRALDCRRRSGSER